MISTVTAASATASHSGAITSFGRAIVGSGTSVTDAIPVKCKPQIASVKTEAPIIRCRRSAPRDVR